MTHIRRQLVSEALPPLDFPSEFSRDQKGNMSTQLLSTIELETYESPKVRQPSITAIPARVSAQNETIVEPVESKYLKKGKALIVITQLCLVSIICSYATGLITIAIPRMTTDLSLEPTLVYWPVLIYTLTAGSFVLLMGTVADVVGSRLVNLVGVFFLGVCGSCEERFSAYCISCTWRRCAGNVLADVC